MGVARLLEPLEVPLAEQVYGVLQRVHECIHHARCEGHCYGGPHVECGHLVGALV